jgi:hypothetical protein
MQQCFQIWSFQRCNSQKRQAYFVKIIVPRAVLVLRSKTIVEEKSIQLNVGKPCYRAALFSSLFFSSPPSIWCFYFSFIMPFDANSISKAHIVEGES